MKVNCDRIKDWWNTRQARKERLLDEKIERLAEWKPVFKFYVRLGYQDCRLFETVEVRYDHHWEWGIRSFFKEIFFIYGECADPNIKFVPQYRALGASNEV